MDPSCQAEVLLHVPELVSFRGAELSASFHGGWFVSTCRCVLEASTDLNTSLLFGELWPKQEAVLTVECPSPDHGQQQRWLQKGAAQTSELCWQAQLDSRLWHCDRGSSHTLHYIASVLLFQVSACVTTRRGTHRSGLITALTHQLLHCIISKLFGKKVLNNTSWNTCCGSQLHCFYYVLI